MEDSKTYKLPREWVERIFMRLKSIYGDAWIEYHEKTPTDKELALTMWCTGLYGLTPEEIRQAISMCSSSDKRYLPTVLDFYHYAKNTQSTSSMKTSPSSNKTATPEMAKTFLQEIRHKLSGKRNSE